MLLRWSGASMPAVAGVGLEPAGAEPTGFTDICRPASHLRKRGAAETSPAILRGERYRVAARVLGVLTEWLAAGGAPPGRGPPHPGGKPPAHAKVGGARRGGGSRRRRNPGPPPPRPPPT